VNWSITESLSVTCIGEPFTTTSDAVGPFDKASEVPFGLDVLSNAKILRPFPR
jgi:hypothetical protein